MLLPAQILIADALPPTMTVDGAASFLGISRSTAYVLCTRYRETGGRDGLPNARFGSRVVVLTVPLLELVRLTPAAEVSLRLAPQTGHSPWHPSSQRGAGGRPKRTASRTSGARSTRDPSRA